MEYIGYILLAIAVLCWLIAMIVGMIVVLPWGIVGLIAIAGVGFLLAKVVKDRLANKEDEYYTRTIEK